MSIETDITRLLDAQGVSYRRLPHKEAVYTIEAAAANVGSWGRRWVRRICLGQTAGEHASSRAGWSGSGGGHPRPVGPRRAGGTGTATGGGGEGTGRRTGR